VKAVLQNANTETLVPDYCPVFDEVVPCIA